MTGAAVNQLAHNGFSKFGDHGPWITVTKTDYQSNDSGWQMDDAHKRLPSGRSPEIHLELVITVLKHLRHNAILVSSKELIPSLAAIENRGASSE